MNSQAPFPSPVYPQALPEQLPEPQVSSRTGAGIWTISEHLIPGVKVGSDEAAAGSAFHNGLPWFAGLGYSLFYSIIRGCWVTEPLVGNSAQGISRMLSHPLNFSGDDALE